MIVAIVITYNPEITTLHRLCESLISQVNHLIVVDNSEEHKGKPFFFDGYSSNVSWIGLGENCGIATAQNIGIAKAQDIGAQYVVLFDQDSQVDRGLVTSLRGSFDLAVKSNLKIGCIGARPFCVFENRKVHPRVQKTLGQLNELTFVRQIISSSMMIPISVLNDVGLKEGELFIDGVDHEWCWRATHKGYLIAISESCVMPHKLGDARRCVLGVQYKIGAPSRLYYQYRNFILLLSRSYVPIYWKLRNGIALPIRFCLMCAFERPRLERCKFMLKGILHGVLGKKGKLR